MTAFDQRRERLLVTAARVFAERGFAGTSMRDLSKATTMSLSGMYYYVKSKDELLFQIQKACFERVTAGAREAVRGAGDPQEKLRAFIRHHIGYFASHMAEMKVLAHEAESLKGNLLSQIRALKRAYVDFLQSLLAELEGGDATRRTGRHIAAYTLFGMMNWIYTWYDPEGPVGVDELADSITRLFLNGYPVEVSAS